MSVSHCMHHALRIAQQPRETWTTEIRRLPEGCVNADCTGERCCQTRVRDYLLMQERMMDSRRKTAKPKTAEFGRRR